MDFINISIFVSESPETLVVLLMTVICSIMLNDITKVQGPLRPDLIISCNSYNRSYTIFIKMLLSSCTLLKILFSPVKTSLSVEVRSRRSKFRVAH